MASRVQSLIFDWAVFSVAAAREWARAHGYADQDVDRKEGTIRIRQEPPGRFHRFRTIQFRPGVQAVIGFNPPEGKMKTKRATKAQILAHGKDMAAKLGPYGAQQWAKMNATERTRSTFLKIHSGDIAWKEGPGAPVVTLNFPARAVREAIDKEARAILRARGYDLNHLEPVKRPKAKPTDPPKGGEVKPKAKPRKAPAARLSGEAFKAKMAAGRAAAKARRLASTVKAIKVPGKGPEHWPGDPRPRKMPDPLRHRRPGEPYLDWRRETLAQTLYELGLSRKAWEAEYGKHPGEEYIKTLRVQRDLIRNEIAENRS